MWDSPETLTHLKNLVQIAGVVFAILAALGGYAGHCIGNRISALNSVETSHLKEEVVTAKGQALLAIAETNNLTAKLAPRGLSVEHRAEMVRVLKGVPAGPVAFQVISNDPEAHEFAEAVANVLIEANWPVPRIDSIWFESPPTGIVLGLQSAQNAPRHALVLQRALMAAGFEAPAGTNLEIPIDTVRVLVGRKP